MNSLRNEPSVAMATATGPRKWQGWAPAPGVVVRQERYRMATRLPPYRHDHAALVLVLDGANRIRVRFRHE